MSETEDKLQSEARIEPVTLETLPGKIRNTATSLGDCALSLKLEWYANTLERLVRELTEQRGGGKTAEEFWFSLGGHLNDIWDGLDTQPGAFDFAEAYASSRLAEVTREISEGIKKENDNLQARLAEVTAQKDALLQERKDLAKLLDDVDAEVGKDRDFVKAFVYRMKTAADENATLRAELARAQSQIVQMQDFVNDAERAVARLTGERDAAWRLLTDNGVGFNPDLPSLSGRIQMLINWKNNAEQGFTYNAKRAETAETALTQAQQALRQARHELLWFGMTYPTAKTEAEAIKASPAIWSIDKILKPEAALPSDTQGAQAQENK